MKEDKCMEIIEGIKTRRSVRKFADQPVEEETLREIVEAAAFAPSWKNTQTTRYLAIYNDEKKKEIADTCVCGFLGNQRIISQAPVLVLELTVDKRSGFERDGSFTNSKGTHWQSFDAGAAAEAFCLAAHEKGLGTVIMGIYDEEKLMKAAAIPEGQLVSSMIALGYPAETPNAPKRKTAEELLTLMK